MGIGVNMLAREMLKLSHSVADMRYIPTLLGRVTSRGLLLDGDEDTIPNGDFLVVESAKPLEVGDRVVCLPLLDGSEYVVIGKVK